MRGIKEVKDWGVPAPLLRILTGFPLDIFLVLKDASSGSTAESWKEIAGKEWANEDGRFYIAVDNETPDTIAKKLCSLPRNAVRRLPSAEKTCPLTLNPHPYTPNPTATP